MDANRGQDSNGRTDGPTTHEAGWKIARALWSRTGRPWAARAETPGDPFTLTISAPKSRRDASGRMTADDRATLGEALGLGGAAPSRGVRVDDSADARRAAIARAEGRDPGGPAPAGTRADVVARLRAREARAAELEAGRAAAFSGRRRQLEHCSALAQRIALACGQPASFNAVLCQHEAPGPLDPARFAAMVASVAIGSTDPTADVGPYFPD